MAGALLALFVEDRDGHVAAHGDEIAGGVADHRAVLQLHRAFVGRLDEGGIHDLRGAAHVERPHGELRARLADRLRGDDADSLAEVHRRPAGKIAPVADRTDADLDVAGQRRANADRLDAGLLNGIDIAFVNHPAGGDDGLAGLRIDDIVERRAAQNTLTDRSDDLAGIDDRSHGQTPVGAAVGLHHDAVLRDVDETTRQITRVRGLQRRICQALAGAVGGVEVLQNGQAFLEVRDDRRLDDLARRLGHQATHAGELLHLAGRATSTGTGHHVDGVHRLLAAIVVELDLLQALHDLLGETVVTTRPGVDDLVVLLAEGDQAVIVLLLVFLGDRVGLVDDLRLAIRHQHVVLAERDACAAGLSEAERHDPVAEDHRLLLTAVAIDRVDHPGDVLLGHLLVDGVEGHVDVLRQQFADDHPARRRVEDLGDLVALCVDASGNGP